MLSLTDWHAKKQAQAARFMAAVPGAQFSRSGRDKTTYTIRCSVDGFEAVALLGRTQFPLLALTGKPLRPEVDMPDRLLDDVITAWGARHRVRLPADYDPTNSAVDWRSMEHVRRAEKQARNEARKLAREKAGGANA